MGPFVPELISEPFNLILAFLIGIAFGFILEQAGFSSSRRLAGVFYGYDFTVLRVFFTAAVTAMSGVLLLGHWGYLDVDAIFINPTWLYPAIVGGVIMGIGFILGGYCPGTSICALAIGKVDALFFVIGGMVGTFLYAEIYPSIQSFVNSSALGPIYVFDSLGIPQGVFAFILIAVALMAFILTSKIEKKVNPDNAPSLSFPTFSLRLATAATFLLALWFLWMPDRKQYLEQMVSKTDYILQNPVALMPVDELAFRLVDRDPRLQIFDFRSEDEFQQFALPNSVRLTERDVLGKSGNELIRNEFLKKVVIAKDLKQAETIARILMHLGAKNVYPLETDIHTFAQLFHLQPNEVKPAQWDTGLDPITLQFRKMASETLKQMIAEEKTKGQKKPRAVKKIKGGC
ncbi:MAG: YeeE/YedE thiosulfate transporter family protein [bacterium]|nr:YeeE/YedE thiosulfate transporter family protein [bacterium]